MLIILVMRMLGEMATANPSTGSFADYARKALGGWAGFSVGWLYWYFWVIVVGFEAVAGAKIITFWFRRAALAAVAGPDGADDRDQPVLGRRRSASSSSGSPGSRSSRSCVFLVLGTLYVLGHLAEQGLDFSNLTAHGGFFPNGVGAIFASIVVVIFSMVGAEIATIAAAESRRPRAGDRQGHPLGDRCGWRSSSSGRCSCWLHPAVELHRARRLALRRGLQARWASRTPTRS